jgi:hypothetical protein
VREVEGVALPEEDRELAALGTEPDPVLAAEGVHVRHQLPGRRKLAVDPAVARRVGPADGRGGDAALPGRDHCDTRAFVLAEHHHLQALAQEGDVVVERVLGPHDGGKSDEHGEARERRERGARQDIR